MLHRLLGCDTLIWRIFEHFTQQIVGIVTDVRSWLEVLTEILSNVLRELYAFLLRYPDTFWPFLTGGGTQHGYNSRQLIRLGRTWEDRTTKVHLRHDASQGEYVDTLIIITSPQSQLWRSIPPRRHVLSLLTICTSKTFSQPKISQL